jgi:hypothetical protein
MNGSEVLSRPPTDNNSSELTDSEKMDLTAGDGTPYANAIKKLMKIEINKARDEAMECDPSDEKKQRSLMTVAHAMEKFYKNLLGAIVFQQTSHILDVRQKAQEAELQDRDKFEEVILFNQTH